MNNDYCSVHYVTDPAYRCERELIPGRMCLAPAESAVGLMDGESHALYADVLAYTCGQHLPQVIRDLLFETAEEVHLEAVDRHRVAAQEAGHAATAQQSGAGGAR